MKTKTYNIKNIKKVPSSVLKYAERFRGFALCFYWYMSEGEKIYGIYAKKGDEIYNPQDTERGFELL